MKIFDSHLIIKEIAPYIENPGDFKCIPQTMEKYVTFSFRNIDFIDSLQFLNASLDTLSSTLELEDKKIMKHYYTNDFEF